jgi:hypothetical protein
MAEMRNELDNDHPGHLDALLASHMLPSCTSPAFALDDFEAYLRLREDALWTAIQAATGVNAATDLLGEESVA